MNPVSQELRSSGVDSIVLSALTGLFGLQHFAGGSPVLGVVMLVVSLMNALSASRRFKMASQVSIVDTKEDQTQEK